MRVRKGKKGLYYTDGELDHCDYNYYNCSLWQAYQIGYKQLVPEFMKAVEETVMNLCKLFVLVVSFPFWGKILKNCWVARCNSSYSGDALSQDFPKDYYEVIKPAGEVKEEVVSQGYNPYEIDPSVIDDTLFEGDEC